MTNKEMRVWERVKGMGYMWKRVKESIGAVKSS